MRKVIPTVPEVAREALILVGGAVLAAALLQAFPGLRDWIKRQLP